MNNIVRWRDEHHMLPLLLVVSIFVLLAIAAAVVWSRGSLLAQEAPAAQRYALQGGYDRVEAGTTLNQLTRLGFDPVRLKSRTFSGLGVQEFFMPANSREFDNLAPAVRACFDNPDRCRALVFPFASSPAGGFMAANAAPIQGRFVFLLKSGRVAYKTVQGV